MTGNPESVGQGLIYLSGGNPPRSPGIYTLKKGKGGGYHPVALWPAWIEPTQERVDNICSLIEMGREFGSREEIEAELAEGGLL